LQTGITFLTAQDRHLVQRFRLARIEMQMLGKSEEDFRQRKSNKKLDERCQQNVVKTGTTDSRDRGSGGLCGRPNSA